MKLILLAHGRDCAISDYVSLRSICSKLKQEASDDLSKIMEERRRLNEEEVRYYNNSSWHFSVLYKKDQVSKIKPFL